MCSCRPEGTAECEAVYDKAVERLKADDRSFLSKVLYGLLLDGIDLSFAADQWGGITAIKYDYHWDTYEEGKMEELPEPTIVDTLWMQCDDFRHGLAAVWLHFNPEEDEEKA